MASWLRALCLALAVGLFAGGEAQAKWLRAESTHFNLYGDLPEAQLRDFAAKLEDFDALLRFYHGIGEAETPVKLDLYVLSKPALLDRIHPGASGALLGYYSAEVQATYAVAVYGEKNRLADDVLFHEYVHYFMYRHRPYAYPPWLVEGWAEYFATTEIKADTIEVGNMNKYSAGNLARFWLSYREVLAGSRRARSDPGLFYSQSWLLTHYLLTDPVRRPQITEYARLVANGVDPVKAMEQASGMSIRELQDALRDYTGEKLRFVSHKRTRKVEHQISVTPLPPSADDLLLERLRLIEAADDKSDRRDALRVIRKKAREHAGDRFADMTLAMAETLYGDRAAGEAVLQRYLTASPTDAEALRLMAGSRMAAAMDDERHRARLMSEARGLLGRSLQAEPDHYPSVYAVARTRAHEPHYPTDATLQVLLLAYRLAPQVNEIGYDTAHALTRHGRYEDARPLLSVLANDPHGGDIAEAAKKLLGELPPKPN